MAQWYRLHWLQGSYQKDCPVPTEAGISELLQMARIQQ